tara:strand:- start:385 stop:690 length:306 start_codon:yes stop_codon:yes gene_type:complete
MIDLLIKLLPLVAPAIRFVDSKNRNYWNIPLVLYTAIVGLLDSFLAYTFMVPIFGFPQKGEYTISDTLERLVEITSQKQQKAIKLGKAINAVSPGHIKALT